jgi:DNA-binding NarL/FixJ family response regulator
MSFGVRSGSPARGSRAAGSRASLKGKSVVLSPSSLVFGRGPPSKSRPGEGGRLKVFILDAHSIYRGGLAACLTTLDDVDDVAEAGSVAEAKQHPALPAADVVLIDNDLAGGHDFIRWIRETSGARVLVCASRCDEPEILAATQAGAVGYLCKETLTPDTLIAGVRAAATGAGVMAPEVLGSLLRGISRVSREVLEPRGLSLSRLTSREQEVLRLVAAGHPTREVARRLCYSERTIKNVIHDVVTKLNARTRSQAVAEAVREGLI